ncbi:hypothetical protein FACS1894125_4600 [Actinomycetota bacterium]|nr:hypothetical protein FACS1894125_4600 [Actinomycetota bacterium]
MELRIIHFKKNYHYMHDVSVRISNSTLKIDGWVVPNIDHRYEVFIEVNGETHPATIGLPSEHLLTHIKMFTDFSNLSIASFIRCGFDYSVRVEGITNIKVYIQNLKEKHLIFDSQTKHKYEIYNIHENYTVRLFQASDILDSSNKKISGWVMSKFNKDFKLRVVADENIYIPELLDCPDILERITIDTNSDTKAYSFDVQLSEPPFDGAIFQILEEDGQWVTVFEASGDTFETPERIQSQKNLKLLAEHELLESAKKMLYYEEESNGGFEFSEDDLRAVAIYLPQFHPLEVNDMNWGKGFTEWTNVTNGEPRFVGHTQPILPADLGFYDLRMEEKILEQITLAKKYGICGFAFYYYWFSGKKIMDTPINTVLKRKEWDFNFTICWANENWTKRWDGKDDDILLEQQYNENGAKDLMQDIEEILLDKRYIRVDGKPVFSIYKPFLISDPHKFIQDCRNYFREKHNLELYIMAYNLEGTDSSDLDIDATMLFYPSEFNRNINSFEDQLDPNEILLDKRNDVSTIDMRKNVSRDEEVNLAGGGATISCVCPAWDNDARRKGKGSTIYVHSSPDVYAKWLNTVCEREKGDSVNANLVFINAWNEWAEGAVLEPTQHYGHTILKRTAEVLSKFSSSENNALTFPEYSLVRENNRRLAVIVHAFYLDLWTKISKRLEFIPEPFDVFITTRERHKDYNFEINTNVDHSIKVYVVPNRGRDVLPFLYILRKIRAAGYAKFLKIHTKKTIHRQDGFDWFQEILDDLLPNANIVDKTISALGSKYNIIGPDRQIVSLSKHIGSNYKDLELIISRAFSKEYAQVVSDNLQNFTYFGGTMFWGNVSFFDPVLDLLLGPEDFPSEEGQIDGTMAHALERFFGKILCGGIDTNDIGTVSFAGISDMPATCDSKYRYAI